PRAEALRRAGLRRVTFSLDTLSPERAKRMSRTTRLEDVIAAIRAARAAGFEHTKINTVVIRGENDGELAELVAFAAREGAEVRFIEYMDVGGATRWDARAVVSRREILEAVGAVEEIREDASAPASRHRTKSG